MTIEPSSAVSKLPITRHALSVLACAVKSKFNLGTNELLMLLPFKTELINLETAATRVFAPLFPMRSKLLRRLAQGFMHL